MSITFGKHLSIILVLGYGLGLNISNGQEMNMDRQPAEIITEIRALLNQTVMEYQNKNFSGAYALAQEAYLENYEFIEIPLQILDSGLMEETEIMLRDELRDLVKSEGAETNVQLLVNEINSNLDRAEQLLAK